MTLLAALKILWVIKTITKLLLIYFKNMLMIILKVNCLKNLSKWALKTGLKNIKIQSIVKPGVH